MTLSLRSSEHLSTCLHCGVHVTDRFRRVYGDDDDRAHRCNECETYVRSSRGSGVYVADDHFDAVASEESVELYDDPTPRLEAEKEHLLMTTLADMRDSEQAVVESIATDGGKGVDELAEETGYHAATIYRAINALGEVLELDDGQVSYRARKYRDELRALVESAEFAIDSYADRMQHIMGLADHLAESSPFQKWLAENGADLEFDEHGEPDRIRIDTVLSMLKSDSFETAQRIASDAKTRLETNSLRSATISWDRTEMHGPTYLQYLLVQTLGDEPKTWEITYDFEREDVDVDAPDWVEEIEAER